MAYSTSLTLLGLGTAGVDYIAMVASFPQPDDKIRTTSSMQTGGGNVANSLTSFSRLCDGGGGSSSVKSRLLTKIGDDGAGKTVLAELKSDNVDTSFVITSSATATAFTYVIVDQATSTRTCIHTPQQEELTADDIKSGLLDAVDFVHLDSRHTVAALALARLAITRGIPVSIDAEKNRPPYFDELLLCCDVIFTNERFPRLYLPTSSTAEEEEKNGVEDAVLPLFELEGLRAKFIVTSLGSKGSVLVRRFVNSVVNSAAGSSDTSAKIESLGVECEKQGFLTVQHRHRVRGSQEFDVFVCPAWPLRSEDIVDTTGAGDAFIGAFLFAHLHGASDARCLQLGTLCAASKIKQPGARAGLPSLEQLKVMVQAKK